MTDAAYASMTNVVLIIHTSFYFTFKLKNNMAHFKVLEDKIKELENYRFHPLNDEYKEENDIDEDDPIFHMDGYVYSIGHSRRGQYYYYIVEKSGLFTIYASKADGDGSNLALDDTFMKLLNDGILTLYG